MTSLAGVLGSIQSGSVTITVDGLAQEVDHISHVPQPLVRMMLVGALLEARPKHETPGFLRGVCELAFYSGFRLWELANSILERGLVRTADLLYKMSWDLGNGPFNDGGLIYHRLVYNCCGHDPSTFKREKELLENLKVSPTTLGVVKGFLYPEFLPGDIPTIVGDNESEEDPGSHPSDS